jgi:hypothetical protein
VGLELWEYLKGDIDEKIISRVEVEGFLSAPNNLLEIRIDMVTLFCLMFCVYHR